MITDRSDVLDTFRGAVMDALDAAVKEAFGERFVLVHTASARGQGAHDADLPELFKGIDAQVDVLAKRYGVILTDPPPALRSAAFQAEAEFLRQPRQAGRAA